MTVLDPRCTTDCSCILVVHTRLLLVWLKIYHSQLFIRCLTCVSNLNILALGTLKAAFLLTVPWFKCKLLLYPKIQIYICCAKHWFVFFNQIRWVVTLIMCQSMFISIWCHMFDCWSCSSLPISCFACTSACFSNWIIFMVRLYLFWPCSCFMWISVSMSVANPGVNVIWIIFSRLY